jgi:hypothetical protein
MHLSFLVFWTCSVVTSPLLQPVHTGGSTDVPSLYTPFPVDDSTRMMTASQIHDRVSAHPVKFYSRVFFARLIYRTKNLGGNNWGIRICCPHSQEALEWKAMRDPGPYGAGLLARRHGRSLGHAWVVASWTHATLLVGDGSVFASSFKKSFRHMYA